MTTDALGDETAEQLITRLRSEATTSLASTAKLLKTMEEPMEATLSKDSRHLIVTIPINTENPPKSASGKTRVCASTHGNQATTIAVKGQTLVVGLNAYIRAEE